MIHPISSPFCVILSGARSAQSNCEAAPSVAQAGSINGNGVFVYSISPPLLIVDPDSALPHRFCRFAPKVRLRPPSVTQTKTVHSPLGRTPLRMTRYGWLDPHHTGRGRRPDDPFKQITTQRRCLQTARVTLLSAPIPYLKCQRYDCRP